MADVKLDTESGDLDIVAGELVLLRGTEAIKQDLRIRLKFFRGEWFLDQRIGVPYYQRLLGTKPNESAVRELFRQVIMATPGVVGLNDFQVDFDGITRKLYVSFVAQTIEGELEFAEDLIL